MTDMNAPRFGASDAACHLAEALVLLAHPRPRLNDHSWPAERVLFERAAEAGLGSLRADERTEVEAAAMAAAEEEGDRLALDRLVRLLKGIAGLPDLAASIREVDERLFCTRLCPGHGTATGAVVEELEPTLAVEHRTMTFVVPFRASTEDRTRNLEVALRALRQASRDAPGVEVTIVEQDVGTGLAGIPRELYDSHILVPDNGPYNKSWSVNVGVVRSAHDRVCVLDADLLVDRHAIAAVHAGLDEFDMFVPHGRVNWMDEVSTTRTIAAITTADGGYRIDGSAARGLTIDGLFGGCFAVRRDFYLSIGGHDERYTGWGGEDLAFHELAAARGRAGHGDLVMAHLNHTRPPVTHADGTMFNEHLSGTRAGDEEIGRIRKRLRVVR